MGRVRVRTVVPTGRDPLDPLEDTERVEQKGVAVGTGGRDPLDPLEDTESFFQGGSSLASLSVATPSIRWRILKGSSRRGLR